MMRFGQNKTGIIMELLHLGVATGSISPFLADSKTAALIAYKHTLSPKDPNFPAWWEEHKSEWEEQKKEGQEPADD